MRSRHSVPLAFDLRRAGGNPTGVGRYLLDVAAAAIAAEYEVIGLAGSSGVVPAISGARIVRIQASGARWHIAAWRQVRREQAIFISTSYLLPQAPGIMCLPAVLDLTTFMVPQFHTKRNRYTERILVPRTLSRWPTITCTRTTALDIARMFPNAKAFVVSPTVSLKHSKPPSPTIEGPPYVIAVGTLEPRKNLLVPIEAVRMMRRAGEDVKLILVGMRGWHFDALRTPLEAAISEGAVEWLGYVSDERRDELYDGASALLFPSHYEGFGLPLLEAMARGLPAITSQAPALVEVGRDGAMHVPTDDPAAWAGAIRRITQDKPLRAALAARGLELASAFTSSRTGAELGHAVRTLLG